MPASLAALLVGTAARRSSLPPLQAFSFDASTGTIKHAGDNMCVDVAFCGNDVCPSMDLELYNCGSPHENQVWLLVTSLVRGSSHASVRPSDSYFRCSPHVAPRLYFRTLTMTQTQACCTQSLTTASVSMRAVPAPCSWKKPGCNHGACLLVNNTSDIGWCAQCSGGLARWQICGDDHPIHHPFSSTVVFQCDWLWVPAVWAPRLAGPPQ